MGKNLVIVESPAKAKTIKRYLGKNYEVVASNGHVRDLPKFRLNVDVNDDFKPRYQIIKEKKPIVAMLKEKAASSRRVFLAADPDREGEAISWHLAHILKLATDENNRVTFNEITENGIAEGMKNCRTIDMNLVNAQQARRILDRIVGYKLSPFISQKIYKGLSAGRVQSVALRFVVEREQEIRKFKPKEYWTIEAVLEPKSRGKKFEVSFYGIFDDGESKKVEIQNENQADEILKSIEKEEFAVLKVKFGKREIKPKPPFITSTLQQEASNKLNFQSRRTMKVAQELYEGVDLKSKGMTGLITYMRTDSLRVSETALRLVVNFIRKKFGEGYLHSEVRRFKSSENAQDAHEAIRPTDPFLTPESVKDSLTSDQFKIYKLIWERFIASQMANCVHSTKQFDISAGKFLFKTSGYSVEFDGFTRVYEEFSSDEKINKGSELPDICEGDALKKEEINKSQHFTQPIARFTEASLIKTLEECGVGRPSTYASIISTILAREYVIMDNKSLKPTELGEVVTGLLEKTFPNIVDSHFTAKMEDDLDVIECGKNDWVKLLHEFYDDFETTFEKAKSDFKDVKIVLESDKIEQTCELCGKPMVVKHSKFGKFIGCSGYPECKNIKKFPRYIDVRCPKCGGEIEKKSIKKAGKVRGRFFYGCSNYPDCDFVSWNEPIGEFCPNCKSMLYKKGTRTSKIFCNNPECNYEKQI